MVVPANLTAINDDVIKLELLPSLENLASDPDEHKFTWSVTSFSERKLEIKVSFHQHEFISAGI